MTAGRRRYPYSPRARSRHDWGAPPDEPDVEAADDGSAGHQPDDPAAADDGADDGETTESGPADSATEGTAPAEPTSGTAVPTPRRPEDVQKYARFKKVDGAQYDRVNDFLRERTYVTAREWAIARLCADFRTETGVEMTKIGNNLPELVPFMTDTYTPQAVNQARSAFRDKVRKSGATFLYGAMSGFFTAEELDEMMYEVTEIAKFLLEVEGVDLAVEDETRGRRPDFGDAGGPRAVAALRHDEVCCPECGNEFQVDE